MAPKNVGLIGAGFGWTVLRPALERTGRFRVTAAWSHSLTKRGKIQSERPGLRVVSDWRDLLKAPDIAACAVAVPPAIQERVVLENTRWQKPLFLEKPFASNLGQAKKMASVLKKKRIPVAVDFEFTELPLWKKARQALRSGRLGRVRSVLVVWTAPSPAKMKPSWKDRDAMGGGLLLNFGSHTADYLAWFLGAIKTVRTNALEASHVQFEAGFRSGATGLVKFQRAPGVESQHAIVFFGTKGFLTLRNSSGDYINGFSLKMVLSPGRTFIVSPPRTKKEDGRIEAVRRMAELFSNQIRTHELDFVLRGLASQRVLEGLRMSARTRKKVTL